MSINLKKASGEEESTKVFFYFISTSIELQDATFTNKASVTTTFITTILCNMMKANQIRKTTQEIKGDVTIESIKAQWNILIILSIFWNCVNDLVKSGMLTMPHKHNTFTAQ